MIYSLYFIIVLLSLRFTSTPQRDVYKYIPPVLFALLIGLRGKSVGVDTITYFEHYYIYGKDGCSFVEPGFDFINHTLYLYGFEANSLLFVCGLITVIFIFLALERYDNGYGFVAICLYTIPFVFICNGLRQAMALAIFMFSIQFIEKKKLLLYFLFIIFASLFHNSSLILLPLYFFVRFSLSWWLYLILYFLSFVFLTFNVFDFVGNNGILVLDALDYSDYVLKQTSILEGQASWLGFTYNAFIDFLFLIFMIRTRMFNKYPVLSNLAFMGFVISNIGYNSPIIGRITIYFYYIKFMLIPYMLNSQEQKIFGGLNKKQALGVLYILIFVLLIYNILSPANKMLPYNFYFESNV